MINLRTATAVAAAVAAFALSGCGGDTAKSQPAAAATSTTSGGPTVAPAVPNYKNLDKGALTAALLPLKAMPAGYSEDPSGDKDHTDKTFCNYKQPYTAKTEVSKSYQKGGGLNTQYVSLRLRQYDNVERAKASFDAMAKTLETCRKDSMDGKSVTYALMNLPQVGDNSLGVRIESDGVTALQGFSLVGPTLVSTGTVGLMSADADVVANLITKQVDQYKTAAAG